MLNSIYDDIAASVGFTATVALMAWFEQRRLAVPESVSRTHLQAVPLAALIGEPALRALVRDFGGETLWLPSTDDYRRFARDRDIAERLAAGETVVSVAQRSGLSERRVEQIRTDLIERGLLRLAEGRRLSSRPGRFRAGRSPFDEILGTGEVFGDPPPP